MGRNKNYDPAVVLHQASRQFIQNGYHGTSIDDLVEATGLLRGSLYSSFGSKEGLFITALDHALRDGDNPDRLGLILVAMLEMARHSQKVKKRLVTWLDQEEFDFIAKELGLALLKHADLLKGKKDGK